MTYKQLGLEEFEYVAGLMQKIKTTFKEIDLKFVKIIGKGHIDLYTTPVYGKPTLKERLLGMSASKIIGTETCENYNVVILLDPYKKEDMGKNREVILFAETTYSINMYSVKQCDDVVKLEGKLHGPNHSPNMSYCFESDTVVFPLKKADLAEILTVQEIC